MKIKNSLKFMLLVFFLALTLLSNSYADATLESAPNDKPTVQTVTCPAIKDINKDAASMTWTDKPSFKSYNKSFASQLKMFIGAQWIGSNVGQVACVYKGLEANTFPVLLIFHTLTLEPETGRWGKDKGGLRNCASRQQKDCAFVVRLESKTKDIYQEAEDLKSGGNNDMDAEPGF